MDRMDNPKYRRSIGVVKFSEYLSTFSKNLTIRTIIITLIILFFNWSKSLIFNVYSVNFAFAKSISLTNNSYIPNPNINSTIPIRNKSIAEIILNKSSLLFEIESSKRGL